MTRSVLGAFIATFVMTSVQAHQGTVGGGGGGTITVPAATVYEVHDILRRSRVELYLFFLGQGRVSKSPEIRKLVTGSKTIFDIVKNTTILPGDSSGKCWDAAGNSVDGSIHSRPGTVCISRESLKKFDIEGARQQALALLTHEYSHLLGYSEVQAAKLQTLVADLVSTESSESVWRMLEDSIDLFAMLRGSVINHNAVPGAKDWNYYCYIATNMLDYYGRLQRVNPEKNYSSFDEPQYVLLYTYMLRTEGLYLKACGESSYHPQRSDQLSVYNKIFGTYDVVSARRFSDHFFGAPVDDFVYFYRLRSPSDFEDELNEIMIYIEQNYQRLLEVKYLDEIDLPY